MEITQKLLSLGKLARGLDGKPVKFTKPLKKIIIHWIGPYPNQDVITPWGWWENGSNGKGVQASAHFILKDKNVLQALPLDEVGWHSGDARNYDCIGIEVIPMNTEGEFSKTTIDTLKLLIKHIRKEIGLNLELERHYDGTQKKDCPKFYTPVTSLPESGQKRWEDLKVFLNM
jgi:hypothetical protein